MYSKNKGSDLWNVTPPPGYDGSRRFGMPADPTGGRERSDGRDESYAARTRPIYRGRKPQAEVPPLPPEPEPSFPEPFFPEPYFDDGKEPEALFAEAGSCCDPPDPCPERDTFRKAEATPKPPSRPQLPHALGTLFSSLARDDLLLIALVILLSGDKNRGSTELLLLLSLLLLAR